jgi:hypothetical protein
MDIISPFQEVRCIVLTMQCRPLTPCNLTQIPTIFSLPTIKDDVKVDNNLHVPQIDYRQSYPLHGIYRQFKSWRNATFLDRQP